MWSEKNYSQSTLRPASSKDCRLCLGRLILIPPCNSMPFFPYVFPFIMQWTDYFSTTIIEGSVHVISLSSFQSFTVLTSGRYWSPVIPLFITICMTIQENFSVTSTFPLSLLTSVIDLIWVQRSGMGPVYVCRLVYCIGRTRVWPISSSPRVVRETLYADQGLAPSAFVEGG